MTATLSTPQRRDVPTDVKVVLSALWVTMLLVFAYVDIFGFYRADVLEAALDGTISGMSFEVNQVFLLGTLGYILVPTLMVTLSLVLRPRLNRIVSMVVALLYSLTIIASCIGESWGYYLAGSAVEVVLLAAIIRTAWEWAFSDSDVTSGLTR